MFLYEKRKNLVFSSKTISSSLELPIILDLSKTPENDWEMMFKLALKGNLNFDEEKSIGIQITDELPQQMVKKISELFKNNLKNKVVIINKDFIRSSDYDIELLVACLGYLKYFLYL